MSGSATKPPRDVWDRLPAQINGLNAVLVGACLTAGVTVAGLLVSQWLPTQGTTLLYILVIVGGAVGFGIVTGLTSATLAFFAYNFFFVPPTYTFTISDPRDLFALFVFFGVALTTGSLAGHMREIAERAQRHATALLSLGGFAEALSRAASFSEVATALASEAAKVAAGRAVVLQVEGNELKLAASSPAASGLDSADWQAAQRAARNVTAAYPSAPGWPGSTYEFHPIASEGRECIAVLGVRRPQGQPSDLQVDETLEAMLRHAVIAFEKNALEAEKAAVRAEAEAERMRSALLSSISHDLKTPLASIHGAVTSLRELGPQMPESTRADLLLAIEEESARLSRFVTNLLDMTRVEAGQPDLLRDWVELQDIVSTTVARARRLLPSSVIALDGHAPAGVVRGDAVLLEHVIFNVLDNAVRYSPPGAPVTVGIERSGETFRVTVEDQGVGIAQHNLPHVFDKFFRAKAAATVSGTGLGLTICKRIIEGMGGTIAAESPIANGRGTRITMRFPKVADKIASAGTVGETA
jgi:two-component system, OmpR family, sensor histidine kinase KdpD